MNINAPFFSFRFINAMTAGISRTFTADPGQLTFYMELNDSVTNSIIARVVDPQGARGSGFFQISNRVTNTAEEDRIFRMCADLLRSHLGDLTGNSGD